MTINSLSHGQRFCFCKNYNEETIQDYLENSRERRRTAPGERTNREPTLFNTVVEPSRAITRWADGVGVHMAVHVVSAPTFSFRNTRD